MKEYVKLQVSIWERILFLFIGIISKDKLYINTTKKDESKISKSSNCILTEGNMMGGNGAVKKLNSKTTPLFKPPPPKPFFDDIDDENVEVNL